MIVREPGRDRYVVIDQAVIRNPNLSYRARGLLALLLSMPDNWRVNAEWIAQHGIEGRDAIRAALGELEAAGHMIRHKSQDKHGRWSTITVVYEQPVRDPVHIDATEDGFPGVGEPGANRNTYKETSIHLDTNMFTEHNNDLCTTCDSTGWQPTPPGTPAALTRCTTCQGSGTQ
jgi:hypothetical protein